MQKLIQYLRYGKKLIEKNVLSYCEAHGCEKKVFLYVNIKDLLSFLTRYPRSDQYTEGKRLVHGTKHRKTWNSPV